MQLKLAEYNADGKFERFLELGKDFGYFGEFILTSLGKNHAKSTGLLLKSFDDVTEEEEGILSDIAEVAFEAYDEYGTDKLSFFRKDEKDPLNRFPDTSGKGLFDGKTYGNGRFVLVKDNDYTITRKQTKTINKMEITGDFVIGNLIENPELWEKVKC